MQIENIASCEATPARADFTADLAEFDAAATYLARRVIERRNTLPILSNIAIEAQPGGKVILTATDCDIWATITIAGEVESPGRFTVSGQALADMLAKGRKTKDAGQRVRMIEGENRAAVKFSRNVFNLPALPCDDFPVPRICDDTLSHSFTVAAARFLADLAALAPCESAEEHRYYLRGTALQVRELAGQERLIAVATDGHNLGVASRPLPAGAAGLPDLIVPSKATAALRHAGKLAKAEAMQLDFAPNQAGGLLAFTMGAVRIVSKLIDGSFADWEAPAIWGRAAAPTGDALALFPELLPSAPVKVLETVGKAARGSIAWQDGQGALLGSVPGDDGLAFLACKAAGQVCASKGFDYEMNGREEAKAYLLALVEARGLPLPADIQAAGEAIGAGGLSDRYGNFHGAKVRLIEGGGKVYGLTVEGEIHRQGWKETVQDWEALVEREIWHPAGYEPIEGSYSILMPAEGPGLSYASEIIGPDGVAYPVAMNDSSIHLSKDQVRALTGETWETIAVTIGGQVRHFAKWLWDDGANVLVTVQPNGKTFPLRKAGRYDVQVCLGYASDADTFTRAEIEAAMRGEVAAPIADAAPVERAVTKGAKSRAAAALAMLRGDKPGMGRRALDNCFEMGDGDAVAEQITLRLINERALAERVYHGRRAYRAAYPGDYPETHYATHFLNAEWLAIIVRHEIAPLTDISNLYGMRDRVAALLGVADATQAVPEPVEAQEPPLAPATPTPEPVNALQEAPEPEIEEVQIAGTSEPEPEDAEPDLAEAMRAMMARLDAIEATVFTLSADKALLISSASNEAEKMDTPPSAEQASAVRQDRSPAHERAVRRAWAERKARRGSHFMVNLKRDQLDNANRSIAYWRELAEAEAGRANRAERKRRRAVLLARRHWKMRLVARYQYKAAERAADHERAMRHRSTGTGRALALQARHERDRAKIAAGAARAEIAKLKRDMADPAQPERASDIARLIAERDTARNALAAVQARADRQKEALDGMADNFEAMALRVAKAEAAMRRAGLIAAA